MVKETLEKKLGACKVWLKLFLYLKYFSKLMWVESICNDESIIENNIRMTKLSSPDYKDTDPETVFIVWISNLNYHRPQETSKIELPNTLKSTKKFPKT